MSKPFEARVQLRLDRATRAVRVCLIHLPTITAPRSFSYFGAVPPLGLAYVAAAARAAGHRVQVVDATGLAADRYSYRDSAAGRLAIQGLTIAEIVAAVDPTTEVIGVSNMFLHQWPLLRELADALRLRFPSARIVIGGENATAFWPHMMLECPAIDVCVLGEGERTFNELLATWAADRSTSEVAGIVHRDGETLVRSSVAPRVEVLDALPWPAWDLFPVEAYLDHGHRSGVDRGRSMPVLTSRGCPYKCSFCSSPKMWTTRYLRRDIEDVLDEVEALVARYRITNIDLNDLTAMLTGEWMIDFSKAVVRRGLQISWQFPNGTRSETVDAEVARWLYRAGCRNFGYAPESGSRETLERIHKKVNPDKLRASLRSSVAAGLRTHANIIIGFPHETPHELFETYRFLLAMALDGLDTVAVMVFAPYPGSEEFERLREQGKIIFDERYFYSSLLRSAGAQRSVHPLWTPRQLFALQLGFLLSFFSVSYARRPARLIGLARRVLGGEQDTVLDQLLLTKLGQLRARLGVSPARDSVRVPADQATLGEFARP